MWRSCEQVMNRLWISNEQIWKKSWKNSVQINKSWTSCEQVMNKKWTSHEQEINKSWTSSEQVINKYLWIVHKHKKYELEEVWKKSVHLGKFVGVVVDGWTILVFSFVPSWTNEFLLCWYYFTPESRSNMKVISSTRKEIEKYFQQYWMHCV